MMSITSFGQNYCSSTGSGCGTANYGHALNGNWNQQTGDCLSKLIISNTNQLYSSYSGYNLDSINITNLKINVSYTSSIEVVRTITSSIYGTNGGGGYYTSATTDNNYTRIYIDFNGDFNFTQSEIVLDTILQAIQTPSLEYMNAPIKTTFNFSIHIPANSTLGLTRMRIITSHTLSNINPCGITGDQVNDYLINIISDTLSCNIIGDTISCHNSVNTFTCIPNGGINLYSYKWYKNGIFTGDTLNTCSIVSTQSYNIKCRVKSGVSEIDSKLKFVAVANKLDINIIGNNDIICYGTNPGNLLATFTKNTLNTYSYKWYKNDIFTGIIDSSYSVGNIYTDSSKYFVTIKSNQCINSDTSETFTIKSYKQLQANIISIDSAFINSDIGPVEVNTSGGTGNYQYTWYINYNLFNNTNNIIYPGILNLFTTIKCVVDNGICGQTIANKNIKIIQTVGIKDNIIPVNVSQYSVYDMSGKFIKNIKTLYDTELYGIFIIKYYENGIQITKKVYLK